MNTFKGVGIQHKNGKIYSIDGWERRSYKPNDARGIAIGDGEHSLCLYKTAENNMSWSSDIDIKQIIPGVYTTTDEYLAANDFHGKENTYAVLKAIDDKMIRSAQVFRWIRRTYGPKAYLPAGGEIVMIVKNKDKIFECSDLMDGNLKEMFNADEYHIWTSTQRSSYDAWYWNSRHDNLYSTDKRFKYNTIYTLTCTTL